MTRPSWSAVKISRLAAIQKKGSVVASLFLCPFVAWSQPLELPELLARAVELKLANQPTWQALTHSQGDKTLLGSSSIILSGDEFDPERELTETVVLLFSDSRNPRQCGFPARNAWLAQQLDIPPASLEHCEDLQEFLRKAPADDISLVYASENISQPSSMMGHILVKISGDDATGQYREHAVSFFTDVNGINFPKIIYDSVIAGKRGYFALTPYGEKARAYLANEQRNIWEYNLSLGQTERELVRLHIWELKDANPSYYFDSYNCATLTHFLVAIAAPGMLKRSSYLMSPLDVVKNVQSQGVIDEVIVTPSNKSQIRMISAELPDNINRAIKSSVQNGQVELLPHVESAKQQFLIESLASSYNEFLFERAEIESSRWQAYQTRLDSMGTGRQEDYALDLSGYKNPLKAPKDGQLYIGIEHLVSGTYLKIGGLPISHTLIDDNQQFFSETELRVGDLSVLIGLEDGDIELNELQIYSAESYLPLNYYTGGLSGKFRFGIEQQFDANLNRRTAGNVAGALGYTYEPLRQVALFAVVNAGLGYVRDDHAYLYAGPEVGMIVNEKFNMKTVFRLSKTFNQVNSSGNYVRFAMDHAVRINDTYTLTGNLNYLSGNDRDDLELGVTLKYLF